MTKEVHITSTKDGTDILEDGAPSLLSVEHLDMRSNEGVNLPTTDPSGQIPTLTAEENIVGSSDVWSPWGDNDDFPFRLLEKLDKLGVVKSALDTNANIHYGAGIIWIKDEYTADGKVIKKPVQLKWWKEFVRNTGYEITHGELIESLETFYIVFPEVLLGKDGKPISVRVLDTPRTRLGKRNKKGRIEYVYYNVHENVGRDKLVKINVYDPTQPKKYSRFVYPLMYRTLGKTYYPEPNYYATFRAGWADVAISVADFMKNVYKNMMSLKYHVTIPLSTMKVKYKNWDEKSEKEQLDLILDFKSKIDDHLTKAENAGKSILSVYDDEGMRETVKIEPIKSYLDIGANLPSNVAANSEMLFAVGTDPALVGLNNPGGGKDLNGSGGSDKRESRKGKQQNQYGDRTVSKQILNLLAMLHGEDPDIYPAYVDSDTSQTMDQNPTGSQNIVQ